MFCFRWEHVALHAGDISLNIWIGQIDYQEH